VIITASSANEVSVERTICSTAFSLLPARRTGGKADLDRDSMSTVDEAYRYVYDQVPRATGQEQHPVKKGRWRAAWCSASFTKKTRGGAVTGSASGFFSGGLTAA